MRCGSPTWRIPVLLDKRQPTFGQSAVFSLPATDLLWLSFSGGDCSGRSHASDRTEGWLMGWGRPERRTRPWGQIDPAQASTFYQLLGKTCSCPSLLVELFFLFVLPAAGPQIREEQCLLKVFLWFILRWRSCTEDGRVEPEQRFYWFIVVNVIFSRLWWHFILFLKAKPRIPENLEYFFGWEGERASPLGRRGFSSTSILVMQP